ncbi:DNA packaging protein [Pseudomonas phage PspYZU08]|jgi:DNA packaging/maturation protein A|uniref:DNA packaging protein n=2 Tax=Pijolavirus TaxID=2732692 RepID=A0AAE9VH74_9CAUD|nr:terminase small subunit [Pseudomonas phage PspYZU08]ASD52221.1 DNA packaging protein [Pseudomonas phage PspYZU08]WAX22759.1 DNA packaging protein [Pseudomonas phage UFJF_PfSW6]DAI17648.1 MAG TPA: Terminase [Caudoviricetes sp.]
MSSDVLQQLLEAIDTEKARYMLSDLRDPEKRTPQLYNAIEKLLERHKFTISKLTPDASLLGELASALDEVDELTDAELYTQH